MVQLANNRRKDLEARRALEKVQSRYLQQTGEVSVDVCTQPRKLYESLLREVLLLAGAEYGCVMRLTGGELAESPFLELVSVVASDGNNGLSRQYDTLLNRRPDSLMQTVMSSGTSTWANNKRTLVPSCLPDCRPAVRNFVVLPLVTGRKTPSLMFIANAEKSFNDENVARIETIVSVFVRLHKSSSASKQAQVAVQKHRQDNRHYTRLLNANFNGVMTIDIAGEISAINPACERYFDVIASMACGQNATNFISGQVLEPLLKMADSIRPSVDLIENSMADARESVGFRSDGSEFPILVAAFFSRIEEHICVTLIIDDLSDRYESARESEQAFFQMKTLTNLAPVGILQLAVDWTCQYANDMWYQLSDLTTEESLGEGWIDAIHGEDVHETLNDLRDSVCSNSIFKKELRLQQPLGGITWVSMSATSTVDEQNKLTGFLVVFTDITEKHLAAERLRQIAHHDTLTGLLNRLYFRDTLAEALAWKDSDQRVGLLLLDLDGFKAVNDSLGHDAGDVVLREAADRIRHSVRESDIVSRLGGDEFTVTIPKLDDAAQTQVIAEKIIRDLQKPIFVSDVEVGISASVGIAIGQVGQIGCDELIKQADIALYSAKQTGRSKSIIYTDALSEDIRKHSELNAVIRQAVERAEFTLMYQPQMNLNTQKILGFEALLRLPQQFGMDNMPCQVIEVLEDNGMIAQVGAWALHKACRDFMEWRRADLLEENCRISVNVSARQLANSSFLSSIDSAIEASGIQPSDLVVELTESAFIDNTELMIQTINAIKARGIKISLDDFGTGYSSLSYLSRLPIDHLKIDQSFVFDLCSSNQRLAIVRAIIGMAKAMDISVVAEGVESNDIVHALVSEGCDAYQGFYFSKPKTFAEIKDFLSQSSDLKIMHYSAFYDLGKACEPAANQEKHNGLFMIEVMLNLFYISQALVD